MSNMNDEMDLPKVRVSGPIGIKELVNVIGVLEHQMQPMVNPQLVIDRGRVHSMQVDGE